MAVESEQVTFPCGLTAGAWLGHRAGLLSGAAVEEPRSASTAWSSRRKWETNQEATCQLPRVGAASGTPQGAPNGLLGIWRVALPSEKADALRRDQQTPGGLSSPWLSKEEGQEKWPCGYMGVRDWSSLCARTEAEVPGALLCERKSLRKAPGRGSQATGESQAAIGLGPGLTRLREHNQFTLSSESHFFLIYIRDTKPEMTEITGFQLSFFGQAMLYSNEVL